MNNQTVHRCIAHMIQNDHRYMTWLMHDMIGAWWYYLIWYLYMNDSITEICIYVWSRYDDKCFTVGSHNYFIDTCYITCLCLIPTHWVVIRSYLTELWAHTPIVWSAEIQVSEKGSSWNRLCWVPCPRSMWIPKIKRLMSFRYSIE